MGPGNELRIELCTTLCTVSYINNSEYITSYKRLQSNILSHLSLDRLARADLSRGRQLMQVSSKSTTTHLLASLLDLLQ